MIQQLNMLNNDINERERNRLLHKLLPFFLVLSFAFLELFSVYSSVSTTGNYIISLDGVFDFSGNFGVTLIVNAVIEWFWFEIIFYFYKAILSVSVFSYTIPRELLNNKARLFMVIRNVFLGVIVNLSFLIPFITTYLIILELIVDVLIFILFVYSSMKYTVDDMIKPNVFKVLVTAFVVMRAISLISVLVRAL